MIDSPDHSIYAERKRRQRVRFDELPAASFMVVGEVGFEPTQPCGNGFTVRPI